MSKNNSGFRVLGAFSAISKGNVPKEPKEMFLFLCVFWSFFVCFYQVTGNAHHNIEFGFVDLEHAEFCLKRQNS